MNRRFRLAAVQRLRAAALTDATRALGDARRDLLGAQERHAELQRLLAACVAPDRCTPDGALAAAERRAQLREQLLLSGGEVERAGEDLAAAVAGWQGARADCRAVEALHERHRLALAQADARREQRTLDDLVLSAAAVARYRDRGGAG